MSNTTNFNYIDNMNSSAYMQLISDQHDQAIEMTGRVAHIFLLDRVDTQLSNVYNEETHGRVYLPHFTQRAIYKTNTWISQLGVANYTEKENNLEMELDFGRMVHNIHELKSNSDGKIKITNTATIPLYFEISDKLIIKRNMEILYEKELEGSIYNFIEVVKKECNLIKIEYNGDSEKLNHIDRFNFKLLPRRNIEIDLNNSIYKNTNDFIDKGDVVVTDRMKLYQVVGAYPRNDSYGKYISWILQLELMNLAKADGLPNDYAELIKKNQYDKFMI